MALKLKPKNILIFAAVLVAVALIYVLVFQSRSGSGRPEDATLVPAVPAVDGDGSPAMVGANDSVSREFLDLLLNIRGIRLDAEGVLTNPLFQSLMDFTITLVQDGSEGRANPFAPIGSEALFLPPAAPDSADEEFTL